RWVEAGGHIAIGSDSNIKISLAEELRMLEYTQRLRDHSRAALATPAQSSGRHMFELSAAGGALAAGRASGSIAAGNWADLLALDANAIDLAERHGDGILDSFVFGHNDGMICDVWSAGRHVVRSGTHINREPIVARYRSALRKLVGRL
ncbi:MAG: amidohydrolase family protein, partial [Rhodospirillaceae bacterium]|nr:amidohydrolase family protein [Rhodospirillaceae bacterium]